MNDKYSFCETATASPRAKWHIRPLTRIGQKFGGGADTQSLCGREVAWDVEVDITAKHLDNNTCVKCLAVYIQQGASPEELTELQKLDFPE